MKTCPFCAETDLQDAAVVCKHCGRQLTPKYVTGAGVRPLKVDAPAIAPAPARNQRNLWIALAVAAAAGLTLAVGGLQRSGADRPAVAAPAPAAESTPSRGDVLLAEAAKERARVAARNEELSQQARRMNEGFVRQEKELAAQRTREAEEAKAAAQARVDGEREQAERRADVKESMKDPRYFVKVGTPAQLAAWRTGAGAPLREVLAAVNAVQGVWKSHPVSSAGREIDDLSQALRNLPGIVIESCPDAVVQESARQAVQGLRSGVELFKDSRFFAAVSALDAAGASLRGIGF